MALLRSIISTPRFFLNQDTLVIFLENIGIKGAHETKQCVEAAAFSYLRHIALSKNIVLISDEAGQFQLPEIKQALCWLHVETLPTV